MNFISKLNRFLSSLIGRIVMIAILYVLILSISIGIMEATSNTFILGIIFVAFGYFGWKALSGITPNIFLIMPIGGWLIYYLIKGLLSILIGAFVAPFPIAKKISEIISDYAQALNKESEIQVNIAPTVNFNATVNKNVYEINMSAIKTLPKEKLEEMHKTLLKYVQKAPVATEHKDYQSELKKFEATSIGENEIYGCKTYGEARKMNENIVKRLDEINS